jgi:hypothetical protein
MQLVMEYLAEISDKMLPIPQWLFIQSGLALLVLFLSMAGRWTLLPLTHVSIIWAYWSWWQDTAHFTQCVIEEVGAEYILLWNFGSLLPLLACIISYFIQPGALLRRLSSHLEGELDLPATLSGPSGF